MLLKFYEALKNQNAWLQNIFAKNRTGTLEVKRPLNSACKKSLGLGLQFNDSGKAGYPEANGRWQQIATGIAVHK